MSKPLVQFVMLDYIHSKLDILKAIETPRGASRQEGLAVLKDEIIRLVKGGYPRNKILKELNSEFQIIGLADIEAMMEAPRKQKKAKPKAESPAQPTAVQEQIEAAPSKPIGGTFAIRQDRDDPL